MATAVIDGIRLNNPELLNKLEGINGTLNAAVIIPEEDGVISASDDRNVMVWLKRDSGQYWPSICHTMSAPVTALYFSSQDRKLFCGIETGLISEFELSEDFNKITHKRDYAAHSGRVNGIIYSPNLNWLLSVSRDKYMQWHCCETGRRLGGYQANAWCIALEFDQDSKHIFVGDYGGSIAVLRVKDNNSSLVPVTTLQGHSGSIRCLAWDPDKQLLFSGSFDRTILVWDIGGRKGTVYQLHGHGDKIRALHYVREASKLISVADDGFIVTWKMDVDRVETKEWLESDSCQRCDVPFFWNVKQMWSEKKIGFRQHHCRKCGIAVCAKCSENTSVMPSLGFEFPVRVCNDCYETITDADRQTLATFFDTKCGISSMNYHHGKHLLVTCSNDRSIKVWEIGNKQ
ncbi:uncharacterized protein TRIADDRAFT_29458 [Trichoplax adhaerens]|uniref:FYVE-type domain-containing protein n=1 Tax=Trichoplax adhaerens TaxID=10228 RepID=B3S5Y0_TRIAD|nr:hypothetical protein TRIADDRAFT_29458 [Trichoplax adhaerens]EDV21990.1 hypothetical protein TRIADDRAFT_29458 [Trichoplax adhaerens]|eukprot:XP_002115627.1 hypothetical protein TRIADDRAFT_29458 [Trichoplax adhaerens]